jgi:hypothetical protein
LLIGADAAACCGGSGGTLGSWLGCLRVACAGGPVGIAQQRQRALATRAASLSPGSNNGISAASGVTRAERGGGQQLDRDRLLLQVHLGLREGAVDVHRRAQRRGLMSFGRDVSVEREALVGERPAAVTNSVESFVSTIATSGVTRAVLGHCAHRAQYIGRRSSP